MKLLFRILLLVVLLMVMAGRASAQFAITGTVTDPSIQPVSGVDITLADGPTGFPIGIPPTITDLSGNYSIVGLPPGDYIVGFEPPAAARLLTAETPVTIVASSVVASAQLAPGVILSGFVRDTNGFGILNIDLKVESKDTGEIINTPGDNTDSTGFYDVVVPTEEFILKWRAVDPLLPPYIPVEIKNVQIDADTSIDVTMILGVFLTGSVQDGAAQPVVNVNLDFVDLATGVIVNPNGDNTDLLGNFTVHVPVATYDIRLKPNPLDHLLGTVVPSVSILSDTALTPFTVASGVLISGTATDPFAAGVPDADIDVRDDTGVKLYTPFANTGLVGAYQFVVPEGTLDIVYQPPVITGLVALELAAVPVSADTVLSVILPAGITVDGTVTDLNLIPTPGVDIDLKTVPGGASVPLVGDRTDATGAFTVVVMPGQYIIEVEPPVASRLVATRTAPVLLNTSTSLPFTLILGFSISGVVTDSVGTLIPGVDVDATDIQTPVLVFTPTGQTNAQGFYEIIVPEDKTYDFRFRRRDGVGVVTDSILVAGVFASADMTVNAEFSISTATSARRPSGRDFLAQNFPNPFNPSTVVRFQLVRAGNVDLRVFDARGRQVRVLRSGYAGAGEYRVRWDGTDTSGRSVASGIYFVRLESAAGTFARKMVLLK